MFAENDPRVVGAVQSVSIAGNTAGNTSNGTGPLVIAGGNNCTLSAQTAIQGGMTITVSVASLISNINLSAGTTSNNLSAVTFSNSNGVSFGLNGSTMTASVATSLTNVNVSAGTTSNNLSAVVFSNSNRVSFGLNGSTITAQYALNFSAGTTSQNISDQINFSNSNGVSFGLNGSTITGSVATSLTNINISAGTTSTNASAFTFSNGSNVSFGLGTGANVGVVTASVATSLTNINVSAGTTSTNASAFTFSNGSNVSFGLGTGANVGVVTASVATSLTNINVSAGTTSTNASAYTFSNANGVTFGLGTGANVGVVTASINAAGNTSATLSDSATSITLARLAFTASNGVTMTLSTTTGGSATLIASVASSLTNINVSAGTTSTNASAYTFSNANNVTFGLGTGGNVGVVTASILPNHVLSNSQAGYSTGTIGLSEGGGAITIATSAGGQSFMISVPQTSSIVGTNGVSISTNGSTISVQLQPISFWANRDMFIDDNSTTLSCGTSVLQVLPVVIPFALSGAYIRVPVSMSLVSTESAATTANTSFTYNRSYTDAVVFMTQLAGASSLSLGSYTSTQATWVFQYSYTAGAQGSRYSVTQNVTYPVSGTTSQFTTTSAQSSANIGFSTNQLTGFTGPRFVDIPFAVSLSPGNYYMAFGRSTNSDSNGGFPAAMSGASVGQSTVGVSHSNLSWGVPGAATNRSIQLIPYLGSWSTNSAVLSTASIQMASVSSQSSHPLMYVQIQRFA